MGFAGVGRMECLDKLLAAACRNAFVSRRSGCWRSGRIRITERVRKLTPRDVAAGAKEGLAMGRAMSDGGVRLAVVSATCNAAGAELAGDYGLVRGVRGWGRGDARQARPAGVSAGGRAAARAAGALRGGGGCGCGARRRRGRRGWKCVGVGNVSGGGV